MISTKIRYNLLRKILNKKLSGSMKVLDVGCGDGQISSLIEKECGCDLYTTDIDDYGKYKNKVKFKIKSEGRLPFKSNSFDAVLFIDSLHHSKDPVRELSEGVRVAKSKVFILETKPDKLTIFFDFVLNYFHNKNMRKPNMYPLKKWIDIFNKNEYNYTYKIYPRGLYPVTHYFFIINKK